MANSTPISGITPDNVKNLFPLFNRLPLGFWTLFTGLYAEFISKGAGTERAYQDAIPAVMVALPGINHVAGSFTMEGTDVNRAVA